MRFKDYKKSLKKEYQNTFPQKKARPRFQFRFKLWYGFVAAFAIVFIALLIEHFQIMGYNQRIEKHNNGIMNAEVVQREDLSKISSKKDLDKIVLNYEKTSTVQYEKTSILQSIFTLQFLGCTSMKGEYGPPMDDMTPTSPGVTNPEDSYQTNVQVKGIDEADVAKCDGKYIYYLYLGRLYIYDISTKQEVVNVSDNGTELYVYEDKIISIGYTQTRIYQFQQNKLTSKANFVYQKYLTSRVKGELFYLIAGNKIFEEEMQYESCYYDLCSNPNYIYTIYQIDLKSDTQKETQLIASASTKLYASHQAFYFASFEKFYTSISIFNSNLEPMGIIRVNGSILNQFSMDEYENYFRVVSTDTRRDAEELNAISIFDISDNFKRVGYLDQGIGKERQTVKSVRFEKNTCYVVTYENRDPLYEIDCSNPQAPRIISAYEAPGYSNYLHTFKIHGEEYLLGLGYTDSRNSTKISIYKNEEGTTQIGQDFVLAYNSYYSKAEYYNEQLLLSMFENHKALFIYTDENNLYLGTQVAYDAYLIFKIDVTATDVITIYKEIKLPDMRQNNSRLFLLGGQFYLTGYENVLVFDFE